MGASVNDRLEGVYAATTDTELEAGYDNWAADYERDVLATGYRLHTVVCALFARHVARDAMPILDVAAGTGLVGETLAIYGYGGMTALDMSAKMLAVAESKGIYQEIHAGRLGDPGLANLGRFAAVIAAGLFTPGHAPPEVLDDLRATVAEGGIMVFTVRVDDGAGEPYVEKLDDWRARGIGTEIDSTPAFASMPYGEPEVRHRAFAYRPAAVT